MLDVLEIKILKEPTILIVQQKKLNYCIHGFEINGHHLEMNLFLLICLVVIQGTVDL